MRNEILKRWRILEKFSPNAIVYKYSLRKHNGLLLLDRKELNCGKEEFKILLYYGYNGYMISNFKNDIDKYAIYFEIKNTDTLLAGIYNLETDCKVTASVIIKSSKSQNLDCEYNNTYIYAPNSDFFSKMKII